MYPVIPWCDVVMFGALDPEGETYKKCRITVLGNDAVLYVRDLDEQRWRPADRLTEAKFTEHDDKGTLTIEGVSEELVDIVGMDPANARVRWEVTPQGCQDCG